MERTDDEHVEAADYQFHGLGSVVQMTRRLRDAMVRQQKATNWLAIVIVVLTVALVLIALGWIGPTHTTSAWVLWKKSNSYTKVSGGTTQWEVESAFETRSDCVLLPEKALGRLERKLREASSQEGSGIQRIVRDIGESDVTFHYEAHEGQPAGYISTKYVCLPDTIDPRERK